MQTKTLYQAALEWQLSGQLDWMEAAGYVPASLRHNLARYSYYLKQKEQDPRRARQNTITYFANNQQVIGGGYFDEDTLRNIIHRMKKQLYVP